MRLSKWIISHFWVKSSFEHRPFAPAVQWLSSSLLQHSLPLSHQRVHTLIWIMFLLQVPPVINGVPFHTMAKSGLYWLTLIIDSQRLLPWFMIVCYFYISCQIHLVSPRSGSVWANSKHPAPCLLPPHGNGLCFCEVQLHAADRNAFRLVSHQVQEGEPQCGAVRGAVVTHKTGTGQSYYMSFY